MGQGGPKTAAGRAASARNALQHGLLSDTPLVTRHETEEDWTAHRQAVLASLQPQDHLQSCLAERVALLHWRLRRAAVAEMELLEYEAVELNQEAARHPNSPLHAETDGWPLIRSMNVLERLTRYEAHLSRELARTMRTLHDLQSRPAAEPEPDPQPEPRPLVKTENCETNSSTTPAQPVVLSQPHPTERVTSPPANHLQPHPERRLCAALPTHNHLKSDATMRAPHAASSIGFHRTPDPVHRTHFPLPPNPTC